MKVTNKINTLVDNIAKYKLCEADDLLSTSKDKQFLLCQSCKFTDDAGRTFHCTAYEYAYWAKDTYAQRMLESHMNEKTKAFMLGKIDKIEHSGLTYQQHGVTYQNPHYDMSFVLKNLSTKEFSLLQTIVGQDNEKIKQATPENYQTISFTATEYENLKKILEPHEFKSLTSFFCASPSKTIRDKLQFDFHSLITALDTYVAHDHYTHYISQNKDFEYYHCNERLMAVGKAQRDLPAHIFVLYIIRWVSDCNLSLFYEPTFFEKAGSALRIIENDIDWHQMMSPSSDLGFNYALTLTGNHYPRSTTLTIGGVREVDELLYTSRAVIDLETIRRFDEMRIVDLKQSRENLSPTVSQPGLGY